MPKKFVYIVLLLGILLTCSIYWKNINMYIRINPTFITFRSELLTITDEFLLQPFPMTCKHNPPYLVIIVTSYVGHVKLRTAHRTSYSSEYLSRVNATRVFLLAQIPDHEKNITQSAINYESKIFGDILQGKFVESYRNLTHKHLMGLKWASTTCPGASFILKVDDDTVYILGKTYEVLRSVKYSPKILMGDINNSTDPSRDEENKWYVTWEEYPRNDYPLFLSGWYYITTPQVAAALCDEAAYHPYFWIDDIFVTGILRESLGLNLTEVPNAFGVDNFVNCDYIDGINQFYCKV